MGGGGGSGHGLGGVDLMHKPQEGATVFKTCLISWIVVLCLVYWMENAPQEAW